MSSVALYSMKGGVGKTAAAVNPAYEAPLAPAPVLLCDLDPQGAASYYFRIRPGEGFNKKRFLKGGKRIERYYLLTICGYSSGAGKRSVPEVE